MCKPQLHNDPTLIYWAGCTITQLSSLLASRYLWQLETKAVYVRSFSSLLLRYLLTEGTAATLSPFMWHAAVKQSNQIMRLMQSGERWGRGRRQPSFSQNSLRPHILFLGHILPRLDYCRATILTSTQTACSTRRESVNLYRSLTLGSLEVWSCGCVNAAGLVNKHARHWWSRPSGFSTTKRLRAYCLRLQLKTVRCSERKNKHLPN